VFHFAPDYFAFHTAPFALLQNIGIFFDKSSENSKFYSFL
jgi:hypothetical protein